MSLTRTVKGAGLGGDPYRDGSYAYYISEKVGTNDPKGIRRVSDGQHRNGELQQRKAGAWRHDSAGLMVQQPEATQRIRSTGLLPLQMGRPEQQRVLPVRPTYSRKIGAQTATLDSEPTLAALRQAQVYIIVSPDIPAKNPTPHDMQSEDATQIANWVKAGGVLMIMENDPENADLTHLNLLTEQFGIHFNDVVRNRVEGRKFEQGKIAVSAGGPIFHQPHTLYMKEICTISAKAPAASVLTDRGDVLMAIAKFGTGYRLRHGRPLALQRVHQWP